ERRPVLELGISAHRLGGHGDARNLVVLRPGGLLPRSGDRRLVDHRRLAPLLCQNRLGRFHPPASSVACICAHLRSPASRPACRRSPAPPARAPARDGENAPLVSSEPEDPDRPGLVGARSNQLLRWNRFSRLRTGALALRTSNRLARCGLASPTPVM